MKRRAFVAVGITALLSGEVSTAPSKAVLDNRTLAVKLLQLANTVSNSTVAGKDSTAEILEALSAKVMRDGKVGALCDTDAKCDKLLR